MKTPISLFLILVLLLFFNIGFSQIKPIHNGHWDEVLVGFEYQNITYKKNTKNLKKFILETTMSQELKTDLLKQLKTIKTKKIIANSVFYASLGATAYIMVNSLTNNRNVSPEIKANRREQGYLNAIYSISIGSVLNWIIKPKKKHYYKFIDTFNTKNSNSTAYNIKIDYTQQFNFGVQITF